MTSSSYLTPAYKSLAYTSDIRFKNPKKYSFEVFESGIGIGL